MSVKHLEDLGVRRVSIGGSLVRATFGLIRRAAAEIRDHGTFGYAELYASISVEEVTSLAMSRIARHRTMHRELRRHTRREI